MGSKGTSLSLPFLGLQKPALPIHSSRRRRGRRFTREGRTPCCRRGWAGACITVTSPPFRALIGRPSRSSLHTWTHRGSPFARAVLLWDPPTGHRAYVGSLPSAPLTHGPCPEPLRTVGKGRPGPDYPAPGFPATVPGTVFSAAPSVSALRDTSALTPSPSPPAAGGPFQEEEKDSGLQRSMSVSTTQLHPPPPELGSYWQSEKPPLFIGKLPSEMSEVLTRPRGENTCATCRLCDLGS
ncbi:filamin-binding LIM protein 1-like isoform X2 [Trachypithecus francoisi]|uniref:filamin-binding LIM protein 1-like isoform X2 n=1 Tax=Trachypithecus francoisi TaxID=54180 RepID=UPI00141A917F|nr:filamin-binding LIM protein 1-like isoform X2 [Trachypithecus francoisi]